MRCFGRVLELQLVSSQTELLNGRRWSLNKTVLNFGLMEVVPSVNFLALADGCVDAVDATDFFLGRHQLATSGRSNFAGDQLKQPTP